MRSQFQLPALLLAAAGVIGWLAVSSQLPESIAQNKKANPAQTGGAQLPKPDPAKGEAAPMNWVLNEPSCEYLLNKAPWLSFNLGQAQRLKTTLDAILGVTLRRSAPEKPAPIDCRGA